MRQANSAYVYFVPYFESPAVSLKLSGEQKQRMLQFCTEFEQAPNPFDAPNLDRDARIAVLRANQKQTLQQIEGTLTEDQLERWHELIGEPTPLMRWSTE